MYFFDIKNIFFELVGYQMSYLEFFGTIAGAIAVWLSARANIWSWPIGIINVVLFFFLFYQVQLYPDMLLQVFFPCNKHLRMVAMGTSQNRRRGPKERIEGELYPLETFCINCSWGATGNVCVRFFC